MNTATFVVPEHQHRYMDPEETKVQYMRWLLQEYLEGRNHRPQIIEQLRVIYDSI
jgi:hypothetical protein